MQRSFLPVCFLALVACSSSATPDATPDSDPTPPGAVCGNGQVEAGEGCDDGNAVDGDGCSAACAVESPAAGSGPSCGNGAVESGEECDDGNAVDGDGCSSTCTVERGPEPRCGDGIVQDGEECDDGNTVDTDACRNSCVAARCGDGIVQDGEECDDGNTVDTDACRNSCVAARCGDGIVQDGEACDDGNTVDTDACRNTCVAATCGDGIVQPGEQCDDGNTVDTDACRSNCIAARCGDGIVQDGEECDDGNTVDTDACRNTCVAARCGDGIVQASEFCDDGNTVDTDGCSNTCNALYRFTTAGTRGRTGPTQSAVNTAYDGTSLAGKVTVTETGIQRWTVPTTGTWRVIANGAAGHTSYQGWGARVEGDFDLVEGDTLFILVGQNSQKAVQGTLYYDAPGGGGSFVAMGKALAATTPLVVAGGGGGANSSQASLSPKMTCGSLTTSGNVGAPSIPGGVSGGPGSAGTGLGRAGGFYSIGRSALPDASSFQDGGLGVKAARGPDGGFGGGAATLTSSFFTGFAVSGGGGGFSGGGSASVSYDYARASGGGGSYNAGRNPAAVDCANNDLGTVEVRSIATAARDVQAPVPGASFLSSARTGTSVTLEWDAASDNSASPLQYRILRASSAAGLDAGQAALEWSTLATPRFTVERLASSTTHHFALFVRDAAGNVTRYASNVQATTQSVYEFTNAGATGRQGPTQSAIDGAYAGTSLASQVTATSTGIQRWVVPSTGSYRIETYGAQGAVGERTYQSKGAAMRGTFDLTMGDVLWILVGQQGEGTPGAYGYAGGGGGTFVARGAALATSSPLIVSGGGGGGGYVDYFDFRDHGPERDAASTSTSGHMGEGGVAGGTNGSKGGFVSAGHTTSDAAAGFFAGEGGQSSRAFQDGGLGTLLAGASGGFGGGGSAILMFHAMSGGGGGYSGGGSSTVSNGNNQYGGGGGSYNAGGEQQNEASSRQGHGRVVVIAL